MKEALRISSFIPLTLMILLLCSSCEEPIDWEAQSGNNNQLVIEAIFTNESQFQHIYLSESWDQRTGGPVPVTDAICQLIRPTDTIPFIAQGSQDDSIGTYQSSIPFPCRLGETYQLNIQRDGVTYSAQTQVGAVRSSDPLTLLPALDDSVRIDYNQLLYRPLDQAWYEIMAQWTDAVTGDTGRARVLLYTFDRIDAPSALAPSKAILRFPEGTRFVRTKYGVTDDYADYLRAVLLNTEWAGGFFDESPSNTPNNFTPSTLGYFTASQILRDTFYAE